MARPTTKNVINPWTWVNYLEVLSDGATEYRWQGTARARDMEAAEEKLIVVLEEEHAERDVHPSTRLDALIQAGVLSRGTDVVDPADGAEGTIWCFTPSVGKGRPVVVISWGC